MSTDKKRERKSTEKHDTTKNPLQTPNPSPQALNTPPQAGSSPNQQQTPMLGDEPTSSTDTADGGGKPSAKRDHPSGNTSPSTPETNRPRQVIAVSASKGPTAFFNLARKFLVVDEMCDLSALEGAIVSAVDAAHLLERSKLATIVCIQTSYVAVEPKKRKPVPASPMQPPPQQPLLSPPLMRLNPSHGHTGGGHPSHHHQGRRQQPNRELRRARIVITVKRTENYRIWLEENPLQAIIAVDGDDEEAAEAPQPGS